MKILSITFQVAGVAVAAFGITMFAFGSSPIDCLAVFNTGSITIMAALYMRKENG